MRIIASIAVCFFLASCFSTAQRRPSTGNIAPSAKSEAWQRAINVLQEMGYVIESVNEEAGLVKTERAGIGSVKCGIAICSGREVVTVTINSAGIVRVNIRRQLFGAGEWFEPMVVEQVSEVEQKQQEIAEMIVAGLGKAHPLPPR